MNPGERNYKFSSICTGASVKNRNRPLKISRLSRKSKLKCHRLKPNRIICKIEYKFKHLSRKLQNAFLTILKISIKRFVLFKFAQKQITFGTTFY